LVEFPELAAADEYAKRGRAPLFVDPSRHGGAVPTSALKSGEGFSRSGVLPGLKESSDVC
jgi:hypothetical protein